MTNDIESVRAHYRAENIAERLLTAAAGAGVADITPEALAPVDEFHTGGLAATRQLAVTAGLKDGDRVLDLGCGIGGPSRVLAAEYGCRVTGVDLSPEFIEAAQALTDRCGLSERCSFEVGDATALRFEEGTFDAVWTEHVVMNVRDRQRFYNEAFRVLRPGGRLAFFDILLGDEQRELEYPLPWARTPEISFVHTSAETRAFLTTAGFVEESWEQLSLQQVPPPPFNPAFGLHLVIGEDFPQRVGNFVKCNIDGRLVVVRGIFRKPT